MVHVRVGVVGTGMMGRYFIHTITESISGADVVAVSSRTAHKDGPRLTHASPLDLIGDPDVDAVIVSSPDDTHEEFVLACVRNGKPVLCEKPLASTAAECLRIVNAEVAVGRRLVQVGYNRRFDPAYVALKAELDARVAGSPLLLHCAHRARGPSRNRTTDMMISNAAVHDFDAARWLLGEEIVSASVYLPPSIRSDRGQYDPLMILLRTEAEHLIDVEIFVNAGYGCDIRAEAVCESGTVSLAASPLVRLSSRGTDSGSIAQDTLTRFGQAYRQELQSWVDTVSSGHALSPDAWDGYAATAVADACRESAGTGRPAQVQLESRPELYPEGRTDTR